MKYYQYVANRVYNVQKPYNIDLHVLYIAIYFYFALNLISVHFALGP